ncbi:MAG: polymer-forming cytoskeletal protein [Candidatus Aminicenantes bacterium]|nr:polymer-forming cytoskeletal protein [Candidatus Aminicenantes bacterium]
MKDVKKKDWDEAKISGYFDEGSEFDGNLKFRGSFRIDGVFKGKVESEAVLIIGDKGKVEAEVQAGFVVINGEFRGTINASERVEVHERGRVYGTIIAPKLVVIEGAYLQAHCQTSDYAGAAGPLPEAKEG